jgi:hypothetical protein
MGLDELSNGYGTDKNKIFELGHWYTKLYEEYFTPLRESTKNVLEIGVYNGESIRLWKDYFINAKIYGIDIDPNCQRFNSNRQHIFIGDQSNVDFLNMVADSINESIDIIIDDGSHKISDYVTSFKNLFLRLRSQGWYVIEDINADCGSDFYNFINYLTEGINLGRVNISKRRDIILKEQLNLECFTDVQLAINTLHFYNNIIFIRRE